MYIFLLGGENIQLPISQISHDAQKNIVIQQHILTHIGLDLLGTYLMLLEQVAGVRVVAGGYQGKWREQ